MFELLWNTLHVWDIHRAQRLFFFTRMTSALGVHNRVSETFEITVKLKITSEATNFITQILAFLKYCGSSFVKTLNWTFFRLRQIVRIELETFGGQCHLFLDDRISRKRITWPDYLHSGLNGNTILVQHSFNCVCHSNINFHTMYLIFPILG
jgi:hypothetical protein